MGGWVGGWFAYLLVVSLRRRAVSCRMTSRPLFGGGGWVGDWLEKEEDGCVCGGDELVKWLEKEVVGMGGWVGLLTVWGRGCSLCRGWLNGTRRWGR